MREGVAGSRRLRRGAAALLGLVAALAVVAAWRASNAPLAALAADAPSRAPAVAWPAATRGQAAGLEALAHCDACHAPGDTADAGQLALATAVSPAPRRFEPSPDSDAARVRAGGAIYTQRCSGCHASPRGGAAREGPRGLTLADGVGGSGTTALLARRDAKVGVESDSAPDPPATALSNEQVAALAAFLRRHTSTVLSRPQRLRTSL
jgi:mono/diheme cytochrome c family protein